MYWLIVVQHGEMLRVRPVPAASGAFAVLDPGELVVLLPQIRLQQLGRRDALNDRHITAAEAAVRPSSPWNPPARGSRRRLPLQPRYIDDTQARGRASSTAPRSAD